MTEYGSNIDFFDEPATEEAPSRFRSRRPGGGGGSRPPIRPPAGLTPVLRLLGLIAFAIVVVVLLVVWMSSCQAEGKRDTYRSYLEAMQRVASDSAGVGRELNTALTTPGIQPAELQQTLNGLAQQQEQDVARASELEPPGRLREQHRAAIEALQFRASGLRQLQEALRQAANRQQSEVGATLAEPMRRLLASDVIWDDQFVLASRAVMEREDIRGIEVPDSDFLSNYDLATERLLAQIWQRLAGASGGGEPAPGRHGNGIVQVRALPEGQVLQPGEDNFVVATANLAFEVLVENSGEHQEVGVKVTLEIEQSPEPIAKEATIQIINPGERKPVRFGELGQIVQFAQKTTLKVDVAPVPGEENLNNNTASYSVTFTLTPP